MRMRRSRVLAKLRAGEVVTCTKLNEFEHPDIAEASRRVVEAARRHGKFAGTVAGVDGFQRRVDEGYRFVSVSADVVLLAEGFARVAAALGGAPSSPVENADIYTGRIP